ncbi:spinster family MFS transporter [Solimonas marina]|uniref:MFS transporter n=1 Tax=Solimonas marina TaxID=2714601 RepID=A0A969WCN8_9GAMM|nr:MFS transporter [Solimonas marina]NKF23583.1 MFS transporter [Solimonas marina]
MMALAEAALSPPARTEQIPSYSWVVLFLLCGVYTFNWMDRYVLVILLEPIRESLGASDTQMGLLSGFTFSVIYSLAGFPIARWADRGSRRTIMAVALAAWSLMTTLSGFARGFGTLALARAGVAVCEAGCSPPAHSLISDYFPLHRRGTAFAIYSLGISFGIWLGLSVGGAVNAHYGWQAAFFVVGLPGLLMAVVVRFAIREPRRGQHDTPGNDALHRHYSLSEASRTMWRRRTFVLVTLGLGLASFAGTGFEFWTPTYLIRSLGLSTEKVGAMSGMIEGVAGLLGTLGAGVLADRFASRDPRWYLWFPLIGIVLMIPAELMFFYVGGKFLYVYYFIAIIGTSAYSAPLFSVGQSLLPPRLRALGASTMLFVLNMLGSGAGNFSVGLLSDLLSPHFGSDSLRHAIVLVQFGALFGITSIVFAARHLPRELQAMRAAALDVPEATA